MSYRVNRSKSGLPTITECGGGASNTGNAIIVTGPHGEKVRPLFVPRGYSNGDHAIFVAKAGMHLIYADHDRGGESATVKRIVHIGGEPINWKGETEPFDSDLLCLEEIGSYANGDSNAPPEFQDAIDAALNKSHCYHCREPHYIMS